MQRNQIINEFTKSFIKEKKQGNGISASQITSTLIDAALTLAFVNESRKSSDQIKQTTGVTIYYKEYMAALWSPFPSNSVTFTICCLAAPWALGELMLVNDLWKRHNSVSVYPSFTFFIEIRHSFSYFSYSFFCVVFKYTFHLYPPNFKHVTTTPIKI